MPKEQSSLVPGFHVSRQARSHYDLEETMFSPRGNIVLKSFHQSRLLAQKMNEKRDLVRFPERAVRAGQLNAMGLIEEILFYILDLYRQQEHPAVLPQALGWIEETVGRQKVDRTLLRFADEFPPLDVYRGQNPREYLEGETEGRPNRQLLLEELLLLWLSNLNPAFSPYKDLFDDDPLEQESSYSQIFAGLHEFFEQQPGFGPDRQNLLDMLRDPAIAVPHSLVGQLNYIQERWGYLLGKHLYRLLSGLDLLKEESKLGLLGPGPARVVDFSGLELEAERFSEDLDWMPRLVILAKNAYVWLDQLSQQYQRPIERLDQIPDEALDTLARWGFSGLWLIGLWQRSPASRRIKQLCGNPEAAASAYSLFDYRIADDLGGEEAYQNLRERAWQRRIRLASDMVPNHMGIDSRWLIEHPEWFLSLEHSPFPGYSFNGPDLSWDQRVGIHLEDHYYSRSDAAVVFKRVDRWTGESRYIYHGNDGTSMPWNDTAQLNYLQPEVREAVIQTILHVARDFPIIRFDAAMTLTKRHYQRLWFPEPGSGGDIPSRAEHGLSKAEFDAAMPVEFWREVVDRVAAEAPDTLLLAEAFWLMEGYFVRTLGMHRVYNSAFMNMLRDEDNAKYRSVVKNTLEFDPEILKRFVNFMNNPDEETAVAQFGKGDKYFGICTLMVTMPGLPMFGHGQIEGLTEKYGMEYRRAMWREQADRALVERHEREIFPLLKKRHLFAQVQDFLLYDFYAPEGHVNEDVLAYSNQAGQERALMVYHNRYAEARGWIRSSAAYALKREDGSRELRQRHLGEGLGLHDTPGTYCMFRDHLSGLEYIRESQSLCRAGLYVELGAYQCYVLLDFREVQDSSEQPYAQLAAYLNGRGVPSIEEALQEIFMQAVHGPYKELLNAGHLRWVMDSYNLPLEDERAERIPQVLDEAEHKARHLLEQARQFCGGSGDAAAVAGEIRRQLAAILDLVDHGEESEGLVRDPEYAAAAAHLRQALGEDPARWGVLLSWLYSHRLGRASGQDDTVQIGRSWLDEWQLGKLMARALQDLGLDEEAAWWRVALVKLLVSHQDWLQRVAETPQPAQRLLNTLLRDGEVQHFLRVNRYQDVLWFNGESFHELCWWLLLLAWAQAHSEAGRPAGQVRAEVSASYGLIQQLLQAEGESDYQVELLLAAL
ncbi:MAG: alpha-amylase [Chloroflexia bacterium]|nr:alpha-amylase [Chloroflexia bacterium]